MEAQQANARLETAAEKPMFASSFLGRSSTGATAQCRDGTYSFSASNSGTCSHHSGVARWLQ
jgi:Protein of unknown function (DUF3761)